MKFINLLFGILLLNTIGFGQIKNDIKMEQRLSFITLGVKDLKTSIDFYENKFGWKRSEMSNEDLILFKLNGIHIALYLNEELAKDAGVHSSGDGFKGFTMSYNAWSEKEVDDLISSLSSKGVEIIKKPQKVFWGGYSSYIADPDGNLWEIAYNPFLKKE